MVATPIGNTEDITDRAKRILGEADCVLAEDTRVTRVLLDKCGIVVRELVSVNGYTEEGKSDRIISSLLSGESFALVSDAGTPCISDPGYILVKKAVASGIKVVPVPGATAMITALSACGLPTASFAFYGFLPRKKGDIREVLEGIRGDRALLAVFYESPLRIVETLESVREVFPDAEVVVCNDLTKKFERFYRGSVDEVISELSSNDNSGKGEYTIVLKKNYAKKDDEEEPSLEARLADKLSKGAESMKDAVAAGAAEVRGIRSKSEVYSASLRLKELIGGKEDE